MNAGPLGGPHWANSCQPFPSPAANGFEHGDQGALVDVELVSDAHEHHDREDEETLPPGWHHFSTAKKGPPSSGSSFSGVFILNLDTFALAQALTHTHTHTHTHTCRHKALHIPVNSEGR